MFYMTEGQNVITGQQGTVVPQYCTGTTLSPMLNIVPRDWMKM